MLVPNLKSSRKSCPNWVRELDRGRLARAEHEVRITYAYLSVYKV
jgi:hypothetical protein